MNSNVNPNAIFSNLLQMQQISNGMTINIDQTPSLSNDNMQLIQRVLNTPIDMRHLFGKPKQVRTIERLLSLRESYDHRRFESSDFYKWYKGGVFKSFAKFDFRNYLFGKINNDETEKLMQAYLMFLNILIESNTDVDYFRSMSSYGLNDDELTELITVIQAALWEKRDLSYALSVIRQFFVYLYQKRLIDAKVAEFGNLINVMKSLLLNHTQRLNNISSNMEKIRDLSKYLHMNNQLSTDYSDLFSNIIKSIEQMRGSGAANTNDIANLSNAFDNLLNLVSEQNGNVNRRLNELGNNYSRLAQDLSVIAGRMNEIDQIESNINHLENSIEHGNKDDILNFMMNVTNVLNKIASDNVLTVNEINWLKDQLGQASRAYNQMASNLSDLANFQRESYDGNAKSLMTAVNQIAGELNVLRHTYNDRSNKTTNDINALKNQADENTRNLYNESEAIRSIMGIVSALRSDVENAKSEPSKLNDLCNEVNNITKDMRTFIDQIDKMGAELNSINSRINDFQNTINIFKEESKMVYEKISSLQQNQRDSSISIENLSTNVNGLNTNLSEMNGNVNYLNNCFQEVSNQLNSFKEELNIVQAKMNASTQIESLSKALNALNSNIKLLSSNIEDEDIEVMEEQSNINSKDVQKLLKKLKKLKKSKKSKESKKLKKLKKLNKLIELDESESESDPQYKFKYQYKYKYPSEPGKAGNINNIGMEEVSNENEIRQDNPNPIRHKKYKTDNMHTIYDIRANGPSKESKPGLKSNKTFCGTPRLINDPREIENFNVFVQERATEREKADVYYARMFLMAEWFPEMSLLDDLDNPGGFYTVDEYIIEGLDFLNTIEKQCGDYDIDVSNDDRIKDLSIITFKALHLFNMLRKLQSYSFDAVSKWEIYSCQDTLGGVTASLISYLNDKELIKEYLSNKYSKVKDIIELEKEILEENMAMCLKFLDNLIKKIRSGGRPIVRNKGKDKSEAYNEIKTVLSEVIQTFPKENIPGDSAKINLNYPGGGYRTFYLERNRIPKYSKRLLYSYRTVLPKEYRDIKLGEGEDDPNLVKKLLNCFLFSLRKMKAEEESNRLINSNQSNKNTIRKASKPDLTQKPDRKPKSKLNPVKRDASECVENVPQFCYTHN